MVFRVDLNGTELNTCSRISIFNNTALYSRSVEHGKATPNLITVIAYYRVAQSATMLPCEGKNQILVIQFVTLAHSSGRLTYDSEKVSLACCHYFLNGMLRQPKEADQNIFRLKIADVSSITVIFKLHLPAIARSPGICK